MSRAWKLFDKQGFNVIPYKVDYKTSKDSNLTIMDSLPIAGN
jgi:uncharacterized SAM-binding protein YcdF (DUF218 family)